MASAWQEIATASAGEESATTLEIVPQGDLTVKDLKDFKVVPSIEAEPGISAEAIESVEHLRKEVEEANAKRDELVKQSNLAEVRMQEEKRLNYKCHLTLSLTHT